MHVHKSLRLATVVDHLSRHNVVKQRQLVLGRQLLGMVPDEDDAVQLTHGPGRHFGGRGDGSIRVRNACTDAITFQETILINKMMTIINRYLKQIGILSKPRK